MEVQCLSKQDITDITPDITNNIKHIKAKLEQHDIGLEKGNNMIPDQDSTVLDEVGLIVPKKLGNPVKENIERQNLHRQLLFNQKIGKNVLGQKSELQRALEKQKENLLKKQLEDDIAAQTPELEKVIANRVKRLQTSHEDKSEDDKVINKDLLQIRMNLKPRNDK